MPKIVIITLLFSLFLMRWVGPAYTQEPQEDTQQDNPEAEAAPQPEVPKHISTIMIEDSRLSVEFVDVTFGEILRAISQKAGFQVEGSSPAFSKQVTTKFNDLDLDKGIVRLFSLVKESNYIINYDTNGSIAKLKMPTAGLTGRRSYSIGTQEATKRVLRRRFRPPPSNQPEGNAGNEDAPNE
jgi:hypothetical protein